MRAVNEAIEQAIGVAAYHPVLDTPR